MSVGLTKEKKEMTTDIVDDLKEEAVREYLKALIGKLDELDDDDFFGTEGWRQFLGFEE